MAMTHPPAHRYSGLKVTGWLLLAAIAGALTVAVWIASAVKPAANHKKAVVETPVIADPLIKLSTTNPNEMATAVKPITFDAVVRDMRNYPPQFTDSRYLKANAGKWTIQIMNVAEHEVVTDYLNGRDDKDNFKYFRIVDDHNQKRYVVTYGLYGSAGEADNASKTVDFGLPSNVKTFSEEVRSYLAQVDEYEVTPPVSDLGAKAPKEVKLHSTPKVLPAPAPKAKAKNDDTTSENADTTTTKSTDNADSNDNKVIEKPTTAEQPATVAPKPVQPRPAAVPTRPVPRGETLVIQDKPVPAFVEKPATHKADTNSAPKTSASKKPAKTDTAEKPKKADNASTKADHANELIKEKSQ